MDEDNPEAIPASLIAAAQRWVDLRDERTRVTEAEGGELDYDAIRQFEEEQIDAAIDAVDTLVGWLSALEKM